MNVVLAAVAGFVGGILLAPKSGVETRKDLKRKADDVKRQAGEKSEKIKGAVKEGANTFRSSAKGAGDELSGLTQSAKQSASRVADEAKDLGYEVKSRAGRVVDNARDTSEELKEDLGNKQTK
ncbi:MAG TPA: YtxH domain-containing protein [Candidatus Saccharimonadales bacterium]|nr:YtxH domain-containing protein [Candidatus Saccharimonadales bacterium]